jgi:hypothetical protein
LQRSFSSVMSSASSAISSIQASAANAISQVNGQMQSAQISASAAQVRCNTFELLKTWEMLRRELENHADTSWKP